MNIAICISGEPRYYERAVESIKNIKLKYPNCRIDVFCHLWGDITNKNKKTTTITDQNIITKNINSNILNELQTTSGIVDNKSTLKEYSDYFFNYALQKKEKGYKLAKRFKDKWTSFELMENYVKNSNSPPLSQLISMCKSHMIRIKYEQTNDIQYDYVIRTRTDVLFEAPKIQRLISEKNRNRNIIFFPSMHYITNTLYVEYCFFIGTSKNLNYNTFNNYKENITKSIINENNNIIKTRSSHAAVPYFLNQNTDSQLQSGLLHFKYYLLQQKSI